MAYKEYIEDKKRIIEEVSMPAQFSDWVEANEELYGGEVEWCNDYLKHGNVFIQAGLDKKGKPNYLKHHHARNVRAQEQNQKGQIEQYWLSGHWSTIKKDRAKIKPTNVPAFMPDEKQDTFMFHLSDKLLGGPYYYDPHWAGSSTWLKVANMIPEFHYSNLTNGYNIRYVVKVPEDYFIRSLSADQRKDTDMVKSHIMQAKKTFKDKMNSFLAGAKNAGRGLIITKHFYKQFQKDWPELEIIPLDVDLKDEAMLKLFESSNQASTSAHGIPPVLAGLATGAKMTSGSEIRNLYNFWQISATPIPRKDLSKPYKWVWRTMGLAQDIKLGYRNTELTTTDKNPTGMEITNAN